MDTMRVKLNLGVETNIQPMRIYNNIFADRVLEDGTPDPKYLQSTHTLCLNVMKIASSEIWDASIYT